MKSLKIFFYFLLFLVISFGLFSGIRFYNYRNFLIDYQLRSDQVNKLIERLHICKVFSDNSKDPFVTFADNLNEYNKAHTLLDERNLQEDLLQKFLIRRTFNVLCCPDFKAALDKPLSEIKLSSDVSRKLISYLKVSKLDPVNELVLLKVLGNDLNAQKQEQFDLDTKDFRRTAQSQSAAIKEIFAFRTFELNFFSYKGTMERSGSQIQRLQDTLDTLRTNMIDLLGNP